MERNRSNMGSDSDLPSLYEIYLCEVASIQPYGIFVKIPGFKKNGLVHKSQMSKTKIDDPSEMVAPQDRIYCKVISIDKETQKIGMTMKVVNQTTGQDMDPAHVQTSLDEQRRKTGHVKEIPRITLGAVLDTTCKKCGGQGHLASDCFHTPGAKSYSLLPDLDYMAKQQEESLPKKKTKEKKPKKAKKKTKKKSKKKRKYSGTDSDTSEDEKSRKKHKGKKSKRASSSETCDSDKDERSSQQRKSNTSKETVQEELSSEHQRMSTRDSEYKYTSDSIHHQETKHSRSLASACDFRSNSSSHLEYHQEKPNRLSDVGKSRSVGYRDRSRSRERNSSGNIDPGRQRDREHRTDHVDSSINTNPGRQRDREHRTDHVDSSIKNMDAYRSREKGNTSGNR